MEARASAPCVIGVAAARDNVPVGGGCTLYLKAPIVTLLTTANAFGLASASLAVPDDVSLRGQPFFAQGFVFDPQGAALGLAFSDGRALVAGD